jgi:hypothetical protein
MNSLNVLDEVYNLTNPLGTFLTFKLSIKSIITLITNSFGANYKEICSQFRIRLFAFEYNIICLGLDFHEGH